MRSEGRSLAALESSERLTGALLDRLTHHVHILELNGDSYRLAHSKPPHSHSQTHDPAARWSGFPPPSGLILFRP